MLVYILQAQRFSVCYRVRAAMMEDTEAGIGIGTVDTGFMGTTKVVDDGLR